MAGGVQDIPFQQIAAKVKSVGLLNPDMALLHLQTPRSTPPALPRRAVASRCRLGDA